MKIYTKTGDKGKTSLFDGTRVLKNNLRVETYGTIDELNSMIGILISLVSLKEIKNFLQTIQKDLLDLGSYFANPQEALSDIFAAYLNKRTIEFETTIDAYSVTLPNLTSFVLPGGSNAGAFCHIVRTTTRKTERRIIALAQEQHIDEITIKYINRLSDLFFMMSRFINANDKAQEIIWIPFNKG